MAIKSLQQKDSKEYGTLKALLRYSAQYRDTSYHSTQSSSIPLANKIQQYSALGGYFAYKTPSYYNFSLAATLYTALDVGNNPDDRIGLGGLDETGGSAKSYAVLGEAYIKYKTQNHDVQFGRREMPDYRFISLSNIRFSPYTHEGLTYETNISKNLKINLGYISKQKGRNATHFKGMVRSARVNETSIEGSYDTKNYSNGSYSGKNKAMYMLGVNYKYDTLNLEAWNYYVSDFVNTFYVYGDYNHKINRQLSLSVAGQYAKQDDVGGHIAGNIDTSFYGLKAQLAFTKGITLFSAYNHIAYNESSYAGGTLFVRWGTPQMFNSFQVQDSEIAGTKSLGVGAQFELGKMGILPNTVIRFRYANYNIPDSLYDKYAHQDRSEATFDLRYSFEKNDGFGIFTQIKGLSLQFRVAYDDYKTDYDYSAYKAVWTNQTFEKVQNDFVDTRLYIDYLF